MIFYSLSPPPTDGECIPMTQRQGTVSNGRKGRHHDTQTEEENRTIKQVIFCLNNY